MAWAAISFALSACEGPRVGPPLEGDRNPADAASSDAPILGGEDSGSRGDGGAIAREGSATTGSDASAIGGDALAMRDALADDSSASGGGTGDHGAASDGGSTGGNAGSGASTGGPSTTAGGSNGNSGGSTGSTGGNAGSGGAVIDAGNEAAVISVDANDAPNCSHGNTVFSFMAASQSFIVPPCVTSIAVDVMGAEGGTAYNRSDPLPKGGRGGRVQATVTVIPGETLAIWVGGKGQDGSALAAGIGGFNGGGAGGYSLGSDWTGAGGGGGGASDIRRGASLANRLVVAAGGGGAGGACTDTTGAIPRPAGGHAGGTVGAPGSLCFTTEGSEGAGATQSGPGSGGDYFDCTSNPGMLGHGGDTCPQAGGGGGAGYYGGGGGAWGGGGGGSSFADPAATSVTHTAGYRDGDGQVSIVW